MSRYVGLDVHKRVIEVCIIGDGGAILRRCRFALGRESLRSFAETILTREDHCVLEATTNSWVVVEILKPFVAEVVVSNPLQTKAIAAAKVKTDKVDALVLAQLLRCDFLPRVWIPDEPTQQRRRLCGQRTALVSDRTRVKNRIHAVLAQRLILYPKTTLFSQEGVAWLRIVEIDQEGRTAIESGLRLLQAIEAEIQELNSQLDRVAFDDPRVRLLMTMPGVDVAVAVMILAVLGDARRFRDGNHAASYFGLVPSTKQSAARCYHGPITKAGSGEGRSLLIQSAQHLRSNSGPLGAFFRRLLQHKNYNVALTATARKLVVIAWHMLTRNEPYRYANPEPTRRKLCRVRVKFSEPRRRGPPAPGASLQKGRRTKPLSEIYEYEGLPALNPPHGEQRVTASLCAEEIVRREHRKP